MISKPGKPGVQRSEDHGMLKRIAIAVAAGLAINVFIGLLMDAEELLEALRRTSLALLFLPFALIFLVFAVDSLRFKMVFSRFRIRISFRDSFSTICLDIFFLHHPGSWRSASRYCIFPNSA